GVCACLRPAPVVPRRNQLLAQLEDPFHDLRPDLVRARARAMRARLQRGVPASAIAPEELVDPGPGDAVAPGELTWTAPFERDRVHEISAQAHRGTPPPAWVSTIT